MFVVNQIASTGNFSDEWKTPELVLIPKPSKDDWGDPAAYRPLCLLPLITKLLENLIVKRMDDHLDTFSLLSHLDKVSKMEDLRLTP